MALLYVQVDNPDELLTLFSAGALIRWEYSADGSTSWTEGGTEAIVSGTTRYTIEHLTATTYYYRTRYSKASPSVAADYSSYSDVWLVGQQDAYATIQDLTETLALGDGATSHLNMLTDLLADVSADIDAACQRRFYRDPQVSGTTTVYADVVNPWKASLVDAMDRPVFTDGRALDIVSVTSLWVRDSETSIYVEISAGDTGYYLDGLSSGVGVFGTDWPWEDVVLAPSGTYTVWPTGKRAVKIIGAFGFPKVPRPVKRATVSEVRERFRQSISGGAQPVGVNTFGVPIFLTGDSPDMRRIMRHPFSRRRLAA